MRRSETRWPEHGVVLMIAKMEFWAREAMELFFSASLLDGSDA